MDLRKVHIGITDNCNFGCDYCFGKREQRVDMNYATGKKAIDFILRECGNNIHLIFFGGEPLLQFPLIRKLVNYTLEQKRYDCIPKFEIVTNGFLIDSKSIAFLKEHGFSILYSMDGVRECQDIHRRLKNGNSSFDKVTKNLEELLECGIPVIVRPTITPKNVSFLSQSIEYCIDMGVQRIAFEIDHGNSWNQISIKVLEKEIERVRQIAETRMAGNSKENNILIHAFHDILFLKTKAILHPRCSGGRESVFIAPDGNILFCPWFMGTDLREQFGNIGSVTDGINENSLSLLNDKIKKAEQKRFGCPDCAYEGLCGKYCIARNFLSTGDPFTVGPVTCAYEKVRINNALALGQHLYPQSNTYIDNLIYQNLFTV